jgi:signal transduction histidine kinase
MVTSYLSLIEKALETQLDDDTRQFLTFAVDGAKRMDSMILSLLDYSRVGKNSEAVTVISTREAIDEAILFLKPALESCGGQVEISGNWVDLVANRDELTRLFQNLIGNALKYHDENKSPHVEVSAFITSNTFRVEVRDNGIGINPNQIDRLFKVFSRLQARSRFEGTGVGLALCRKIVEHHGGTIGVESAGEGLGCTFWFELPMPLS